MEIILKQDVANLGNKDDIVTVKDGYANNFLIPRGLAVMATASMKKMHIENMKQRAHKEEKLREDAGAIAEKIEGIVFKVGTKTNDTGKIYGSITTIMLAEAMQEAGIEVDRRNIKIADDDIKELGTYTANVKLFKDIRANFSFEVVEEKE
ncbi:MAG: 50S ribosomal protein L9 [Bacteroidales bacterium]|nr:50S ribosomal protein L9 [Bacteroidales bacterium]